MMNLYSMKLVYNLWVTCAQALLLCGLLKNPHSPFFYIRNIERIRANNVVNIFAGTISTEPCDCTDGTIKGKLRDTGFPSDTRATASCEFFFAGAMMRVDAFARDVFEFETDAALVCWIFVV